MCRRLSCCCGCRFVAAFGAAQLVGRLESLDSLLCKGLLNPGRGQRSQLLPHPSSPFLTLQFIPSPATSCLLHGARIYIERFPPHTHPLRPAQRTRKAHYTCRPRSATSRCAPSSYLLAAKASLSRPALQPQRGRHLEDRQAGAATHTSSTTPAQLLDAPTHPQHPQQTHL